jgi:fatty acid desaturase
MTNPLRTEDARPELLAGEESRHWFATIPSQKKLTIRRLHELRPAWNLIILLFVAAWVAAAIAILQAPSWWPVRLVSYVTIAVAIHSLAILMHEGIHGNLFRNRTLDRWASVILGAPAFFSGTAYRVPHILHHRYNRTEKDPDEFTNLTKNRSLLSIVFYAWGVIGMPTYLVHVPLNALRCGTPRERRDVLLEYGLLGILYSGVVLVAIRWHALPALLHCWIIPAGIAAIFGNVRGWAEHMMTEKGHPLTQTRTVKSTQLVSLLMCNLNYHLEHHLFPAMPWYNLPTLHRLLEDEYRKAGSFVYESYLKFLLDAVLVGVHGQAPPRRS